MAGAYAAKRAQNMTYEDMQKVAHNAKVVNKAMDDLGIDKQAVAKKAGSTMWNHKGSLWKGIKAGASKVELK